MYQVYQITCLAIFIPISLACLGGFGGGGSQCCPPRAAPTCPAISQCGQQPMPYNAPQFPQPIPQYSAPQQPALPYYPQHQMPSQYAHPPGSAQPPSPFLPPQPQSSYTPPLNSGSSYLQPPVPHPTLPEKYVPSSQPKPPAYPQNPNFGRKNRPEPTKPVYSKQEEGYKFELDEDDITDHKQQQQHKQEEVESAKKKTESSSAEATTEQYQR